MDIIGIIAEYNPFHNGHVYHINKIKEMYPNSIIILALNGYFLERGEISILTKEDKCKIALENNIDLVVEIPFIYGSQSADTFANTAVTILNELHVNKIVFGSETNDINYLKEAALSQIKSDKDIKKYLNKGLNYPSAINELTDKIINKPNDLLIISYLKSIINNNYNIEPICIKRTNDYHDIKSNDLIISASNIREKFKNNINVNKYTNYSSLFKQINENLLFSLLKYKIMTEHNLNKYLTVDEGIENKLIKEINKVNSIDELINKIKSKRYTYNRLRRMLIHILIGLTKEDRDKAKIEYVKILGFNEIGQKYLSQVKKNTNIIISRKISNKFLVQQYELKAAMIYDLLTNNHVLEYELKNIPIKK